ncbi:unnamed protein product, partial [Ilex paraguariensis]
RSEKIEEFDDVLPLFDSQEVHALAVDDSLVDRKAIERLLKITSCKVTVVDSGRRALQFLGLDEETRSVGFDGLKVDLIITDYCVPGMTGYELLKKIKGNTSCDHVIRKMFWQELTGLAWSSKELWIFASLSYDGRMAEYTNHSLSEK